MIKVFLLTEVKMLVINCFKKCIMVTSWVFQAAVKSQERLQSQVSNFHFNLGFSGWFFQHGSPLENLGDIKIIGKESY